MMKLGFSHEDRNSANREAFEKWWQLGFAHLEVPDDYAFEIWRAAQAEMQREL